MPCLQQACRKAVHLGWSTVGGGISGQVSYLGEITPNEIIVIARGFRGDCITFEHQSYEITQYTPACWP